MIILGLTGSIGMGKTTAANDFRRLGVPVHDADGAVHALFAPGGAATGPVGEAFPETRREDGGIDRGVLGQAVFADAARLAELESLVHPLVRRTELEFLAACARRRSPLVVLDIPLLFETGGERRVDAVIVVTAPPFIQAQRVLRRPGMTRERLGSILSRQTPDHLKRRRADYLVFSSLGRYHSLCRIREIIADVQGRQGHHWPPRPLPRFPGP